jgi:P27 family predicted phage terminase small subunit
MGQARQPINLLLLKGKKHLTKAEIEERREMEIKVDSDKVVPPEYLPKELRVEFKRIADSLKKIEIISNLDVDVLAWFVISREQYVKTMKTLREIDPSEDIIYYEKILKANDTLLKQCTRAANELGLSINARGKLLVPKKKDKEPTEFDKKFGGV